ncbi:hypothetical protein BCR44DRAFT_1431237 [Catenaria anguillulae PL171]|uniref:Uncharacterized protein n=1 Tax=Catenaria anguillulae PL171 TaxID=765915 RepID=A0A1Y2HQV7_9FUNG|nr:hypothetical protein BCR44DRAFT_1431237 [Catenaria anguillulae PL171]
MSTVLASSHDPRQQVPQPGLTDAGSGQYPAPFSAPANLMMSFAIDQLGGPSSNATNRLSGCPLDANPTLGLVVSSVAGHTVDSQSYANDSINLPLSPVPMATNTWRPGHSDMPPPGAAFPAPLASPSLDDSTRVSQSPFVDQPTPNAAIHPAVDISNGLDYIIGGSNQYPSGTGTAQHHGTNVTSPIPHAYAYVPVSTVDPHGCESVYVPGAIHRCVSLAPSLTRDSVPDSTLVRVDSASMFGQDPGGPRSRSDSTATLDAKAHASPGLVANSNLQPSLGRQAF